MGPIYCTKCRTDFADEDDHPECDGQYPNPFANNAPLTVGEMAAAMRANMEARQERRRDVARFM